MNQLDFDAINQALDPESVLPQWLPNGHKRGNEWVSPNPTRNDRNPGSFTINRVQGNWKDYATGDGGSDLVSLYAYLFHGNDQGAAAKELAANLGVRIGDPETRQRAAEAKVANIEDAKPEPIFPVPPSADRVLFKHPRFGEPVKTWEYRDREGRVLLYVCRFEPEGERKQIIPRTWCRHPDGTERWTWRGITGTKKRPLYGLDRLALNPEADAIVVEGEKTADAAQRLFGDSAICVSWLGGVESADRVNINMLAGRRVVLWPDFDALRERLTKEEDQAGVDPATKPLLPMHAQPGIRAMMHFAQALKGVARETIMVGYTIDPERHGWDLADAEAEGWTTEQAASYMVNNAADPWLVVNGRRTKAQAPAAVIDIEGGADVTPPAGPMAPEARKITPIDAVVNAFGWPHMTEKGAPLNTVENLEYMLGEYDIHVRYNQVRKSVEVTVPGRSYSMDNRDNCSLAELNSIAARNRMPQSMLADYIKLLADRNAYNPAADWITSKPWDGVNRLQSLLDTVQVAGSQSLKEKLMRRWLISAVAALFKPSGFESHGALVFTGAQGVGKTTWFRRLMPAELGAMLTGAMVDPAQKDTVTNAISHWIVELGELDATFRKADIARLKSFLVLPVDKLRRPYDRIESAYQRRTVFCASVNDDRYLVDDTGNRRWWTIAVVSIDYLHELDMQQVWAEVLELFRAGEQWWLTKEENDALGLVNAEHEAVDPLEELVLAAFDWDALADLGGWKAMTATDVLGFVGYDKPTKAQATHASKVLKKLTGADPHRTGKGRFFKMPPPSKRPARDAARDFASDDDRPF